MNSIVLLLRVALTAVFATAGLAKFSDLNASRDTVEAFGVPHDLAQRVGTLLPCAELAVAVALLVQASARWSAVAALALLLIFSAGVAYALSQGRTPDCNCFGQVSSQQISSRTVLRNVALAVVAAVAVWKAPGSSLSAWTRSMAAANLVAGLAVIAAALLTVAAFHFRQRALAAPAASADEGSFGDALHAGVPAPDFELPSLDGGPLSRDALLERGLPLVLIFASPSCAPCQTLLPELARWHGALSERLTLVLIESGSGDHGALRDQLHERGDLPVLLEPDRELAEAYRARATPTGIAVSTDGRISSPPLPGRDQIESLIRTVLETGGEPPTPQVQPLTPVRA